MRRTAALIGLILLLSGQAPAQKAQQLPRDVEQAAAPLEHLTKFDPTRVELRWIQGHWQLRSGDVLLKDFDTRETEARQTLRLFRDLRLSHHGTVGTPRPILEYWLADGHAPEHVPATLRSYPFDRDTLQLEQVQGQWVMRDAARYLFSFGSHEEDARQALEIIRHHGFTQVAYVGHPTPDLMLFVAGTPKATTRASAHNMPGKRTGFFPEHQKERMPGMAGKDQAQPGLTPTAAVLPNGRQLSMPDGRGPNAAKGVEHVPLDWRFVQVRRDNHGSQLVYGTHALADFGTDDAHAREAMAAVHYYHATEQVLVGRPKPTATFFLVNGQVPRGVKFGLQPVSFRSDLLKVEEKAGAFGITDGTRTVLACGANEEDAREIVDLMRRQRVDQICRIGTAEPPVFVLVRSR